MLAVESHFECNELDMDVTLKTSAACHLQNGAYQLYGLYLIQCPKLPCPGGLLFDHVQNQTRMFFEGYSIVGQIPY